MSGFFVFLFSSSNEVAAATARSAIAHIDWFEGKGGFREGSDGQEVIEQGVAGVGTREMKGAGNWT